MVRKQESRGEGFRRAVALATLSHDVESKLDELSPPLPGPTSSLAGSKLMELAAQMPELPGPSSNAHARFDAVYINLASRLDRRGAIEEQLRAAGIKAARFEARTGDNAPTFLITESWNSRLNARYGSSCRASDCEQLSSSERGCAFSHALLWAACAARDDNASPLLILEDDVLLEPEFMERCQEIIMMVEAAFSPAERQVLLYPGADVASWRSRRNFGTKSLAGRSIHIREAKYLWHSSSYVLWPAAARQLLANLPVDKPLDDFIAKLVYFKQLHALVMLPQLARQASCRHGEYGQGDIMHSGLS